MFLRRRPDLLSIMVRDRTNPWTRFAGTHKAIICTSFDDIQPQSSRLQMVDHAAAIPTAINDELGHSSSSSDDVLDLLDPILLGVEDDEVSPSEDSHTHRREQRGRDPSFELFGQQFHFIHDAPAALAMENNESVSGKT